MKNITVSIFLMLSLNCFAQQDTAKIKGLQLQARLLEYLISQIMIPNNDSLFQVYINLRPIFRPGSAPSGNTLVTIDSIPTVELASLYWYVLSQADGLGVGPIMKAQIAATRASNSYLDRLCTQHEFYWQQTLQAIRQAGRKVLRGQ